MDVCLETNTFEQCERLRADKPRNIIRRFFNTLFSCVHFYVYRKLFCAQPLKRTLCAPFEANWGVFLCARVRIYKKSVTHCKSALKFKFNHFQNNKNCAPVTRAICKKRISRNEHMRYKANKYIQNILVPSMRFHQGVCYTFLPLYVSVVTAFFFLLL